MIGMSIGGSANFTHLPYPPWCLAVRDSAKVNSVVFPHPRRGVPHLSFVVIGVVSTSPGGNLRYPHFCRRIRSPALIVLLVDEHRFNKDWRQGQNARSASS